MDIEDVVLRLPEDVHKLCRTCMAVTDNEICHDIVLFQENNYTIAGEMINSCCLAMAFPDDGLPKSICDECASKLEIAYHFKSQCELSETNLREILSLPTPGFKDEDNSKKTGDCVKVPLKPNKGVVLFDTRLEINFIENFSEENRYGLIDDQTESLQFDIFKIFEEQHNQIETEILENNIETEDTIALIEERKQCKSNQDELFIKTTQLYNNIKEEIFSDTEENACKYCEMIFTSNEDLLEHQDDCNADHDHKIILEKILKLENGTLEKVELFDDETNDSLPPYMCTICGSKFKTKYARNGHMSTHGPIMELEKVKYEFHCDICNKIFYSETKLATHFYKHAIDVDQIHKDAAFAIPQLERTSFTCYLCQKQCEDATALKQHTDTQHTDSFTCEVCQSGFQTETNLIKHLRKHGMYISLCNICHKRFDTVNKLKEHMKSHIADKARKTFKCPICKSQFGSVDILKNHSVEHLGDFFECKKCKRNFGNKIAFENHEKQHREPRFLCFLCGKQYFSSVTLQCHIRAHNNEKPFVCTHCKKGFSSRATLSVHKRIHSKLKPYVCSYCGYSCRQSGDLTMHIRTHTGDKPYKCSFPNCDRKFTTSSQRKEHYRRHTNERNHKCALCGKAFLESKTLKVHMLTHTGEKPHPCKICGKRFRRTHHLTNHMKGHSENYVKV